MPEQMSPQEEQVYSDAPADPEHGDDADELAQDEIDELAGEHTHEGDDGASRFDPADVPPPSPPAATVTPEAFERAAKKVAQAFVRYTKVVADQFPQLEADLTPCPLCPELHPGFVNVADAGRLPEEVAQVVDLFLGRTQEAEYLQSPETAACDRCDALGKVRSGSKVANYALLTCPKCNGTGFYPPPNGASPATVTPFATGSNGSDEQFRAAPEDADAFGSPRLLANGTENPNYGRMPQYKDPKLP